jgi:hypothetical protein
LPAGHPPHGGIHFRKQEDVKGSAKGGEMRNKRDVKQLIIHQYLKIFILAGFVTRLVCLASLFAIMALRFPQ